MKNDFDKLEETIKKMESSLQQPSPVFVEDGKRRGSDVGVSENMVKGTTLSANAEEANVQKKFEDCKLGKLEEPLTDAEKNKIVEKYLLEMMSKWFEGV